jgi:hypothetical protein
MNNTVKPLSGHNAICAKLFTGPSIDVTKLFAVSHSHLAQSGPPENIHLHRHNLFPI